MFREKYKEFVKRVMQTCFPAEKWMLYQALPNIRFHLPGSTTIPPHRDSDIGKDRTPHPAGEANFLLTFTRASKTSSMILEGRPGFADWVFMEQVLIIAAVYRESCLSFWENLDFHHFAN